MILPIIIIILTVVLDQISKLLVLRYLVPIKSYPVIENIFHFTYVENRGAAFGILSENRWVFLILSTVGILAMIVWLYIEKPKSKWITVAVSLVIGGGIGNMIDRVRLGYVVDFLDFRFFWDYVFNIADSFVCVGCGIFAVVLIISEIKEYKAKKVGAESGESNG